MAIRIQFLVIDEQVAVLQPVDEAIHRRVVGPTTVTQRRNRPGLLSRFDQNRPDVLVIEERQQLLVPLAGRIHRPGVVAVPILISALSPIPTICRRF